MMVSPLVSAEMRMARVLLPPSVPCRRAQHWPRARGGQARTTGKKKAASWMEAAPRGSANQAAPGRVPRSEEHTSELQSLMRTSYAVFCLKKKTTQLNSNDNTHNNQNDN